MTKREEQVFYDLMDMYQFEVTRHVETDELWLTDLQDANLGGICDVPYKDEWAILDRMEMYHDDYIIEIIKQDYRVHFDTYKEYVDFLKSLNNPNEAYTIEILELIIKGQD
jgi:hypothetical protein